MKARNAMKASGALINADSAIATILLIGCLQTTETPSWRLIAVCQASTSKPGEPTTVRKMTTPFSSIR